MAEQSYSVGERTKQRILRMLEWFENRVTVIPEAPGRKPPPAHNRIVLVKVLGAASGGGKYEGRIVLPRSSAVATGNLTEDDFGQIGGDDDSLVLNAQEVGKSTHDLTSVTPVSKIHLGFVCGVTDDGKSFVAINADDWEDCT